jgi:hypothetical protein
MVAGGKSNRGRTGEDYRGGAEGARAIGETKMQLYPDDLWKRDPTRHPSFPIPDQRDVPLWRYLSGTRFRWLVENQRLYMPRIEQLTSNDAREATMPDAQAEFWKELIEKSETPQRREQNQNNFNRLLEYVDRFRASWFVSCWHQNPIENFAFWRIYGREETACPSCERVTVTSGESVAITTTFDKLESLLPAHIEVGAVRYVNYQTEGINRLNMFDYVMHKRDFYQYECEVRAVATTTDTWMSGAVRDHILANQVQGSYAPPVNVKAMVGEVVIHPEAKQSFREEIAAICKKHALREPRLSGLA